MESTRKGAVKSDNTSGEIFMVVRGLLAKLRYKMQSHTLLSLNGMGMG